MANRHTITDLYQMQSLPLDDKVQMTKRRIDDWVNQFGEDGVYVSFSGGKDSTVLVDIVRNVCGYKDIPLVFVDVPTQYPELKQFAMTFDNLEILKPRISFAEVCSKYGFPLFSKEISSTVYEARKYFEKLNELRKQNKILTNERFHMLTE
jgi:3'-phosphoadenosine 5'-phosphosulfate sulfotransferase (PAPS reductase)/FAD synthetase